MAYQLYRNTTLGNSLQESLDELIQSQQITPQLALQVLLQFDKAINAALAQRVRNRVNFRCLADEEGDFCFSQLSLEKVIGRLLLLAAVPSKSEMRQDFQPHE
uniref:Transcription initiation factor IIA gamma chain n=1 Tax=Ficedula albicollis TaxID=59894 RepID=A0A803WBK2_FICAL